MSVQEAVPLEDNPHLARIFGPDILGRLPTTGQDRVRRTALAIIGQFFDVSYLVYRVQLWVMQARMRLGLLHNLPARQDRHRLF